MKIYLGADHAGFHLKEKIKKFLDKQGIEYEDKGPHKFNPLDDYPDFVIPAAKAVAKTKSKGIILGGSGQGEAIAANKVKGIRSVVYYGGPTKLIKLSREHNASNILSLGARFLKEKEALKVVKLWLETPFSKDPRHKRRIAKIARFER
ncbi:RpiB/LacA/LacB family sugar-phosphate isomerase [Nanoarchaeota archaeon]